MVESTNFLILHKFIHLIPATFSLLIEKIIASFDFSPYFCQNRHKIYKNLSMIRDIRDIKYPRLLNFCNFATFSTHDFSNYFFSRHLIPATFSTKITRIKSRLSRHQVPATFSTIKVLLSYPNSSSMKELSLKL